MTSTSTDHSNPSIPSRRGLLLAAGAVTSSAGLLLASRTPAAADPGSGPVVLVGDGSTDNGPLIQAAYDAGARVEFPDSRGRYLIDTPVFFDEGVIMPTYELNGNGAELIAGENLPNSNFGEGTTAFMFYPNTLRTALEDGVVTVSDATRATGTSGAFTSFVLRNVEVTGQQPDYGISFDNRCGVVHENITMTGGRVGSTWHSYAEPHVYREIYFRTQGVDQGQVPGAFYVYGTSEGDGVHVSAMKCSGAVGGVLLTRCRGAIIDANITTKLRFVECEGVSISGLHQEADSYTAYAPNVEIVSSTVTFTGGVLYRPQVQEPVGVVTISDTHSERASQVDFHGTLFTTLIRHTTLDPELGAHIHLSDVSNGSGPSSTRVRGFGVKNKLASTGSANAGVWRPAAGLDVRADDEALHAALTSVAGLSQLATGDFDIHRGVGGTWAAHTPSLTGLAVRRRLPAPDPLTAATAGQPAGALDNGHRYRYTVAFRDCTGQWTDSAGPTDAVPETGSVRLLLQGAASPSVVCLWRSATDDPADADAYAELTFSDPRSFVMDTGTTVNGMRWRTQDIPPLPTANATADELLLHGAPIAHTP